VNYSLKLISKRKLVSRRMS